MANLDYIIDEVEKLQKKEKSLAKHLDPEKNYEMNKSSTEDIESHPDYKRKLDEFDGWGYIYNEEGERDYGNLNEEGKFIFDKDKEEVIDDKDEILIDDKDEIVVDDKDEVENKIEIDGGAALSDKILLPREKPTLHKKKNAFANFTENVGSAFENIATALPKKMEEVFADKDRKRMFLRGLEIINSSSGLTSLSQAKSPLGKISEGLLKAESKFAAEDLAKYKAENPMRRYESIGEKAIYDDFKGWKERIRDSKKAVAVADKYNLAKNIALDGKELPTGVLNKTFSNLKAVLSEVPGGEEIYNNLVKTFSDEDYIKEHGNKMGLNEQVIFNDLFQAATYAQVVKEVKELYPVSNKDIETLLKAKGDIGSKPEALRRLIAAQMAAREISLASEDFAYKLFAMEDSQFESKSIQMSEKMISDKLRKENLVTDETLETLFGSKDDVTDAGYISAYYYQTMKVKESKLEDNPYEIFVTAEKKKEEIKKKKIEKYQN